MSSCITPMIHVPDVRATVEWYRSIGFTLISCHADGAGDLGSGSSDEQWDWARVGFGDGSVMFSNGGATSDARRREADLYINVQAAGKDVDDLYRDLRDRIDVVEAPYDAFHGKRELIIRDINGFWITFAQPVAR